MLKIMKKYIRNVVDHGSLRSVIRKIVGDVVKKKKTFEAMKDVKKDMMGVRNVNVLLGES
jgi:hypothetical protein